MKAASIVLNGDFLVPNDFQNIKISEDTYNSLWYNITLIRNNTDYMSKFWSHSNQYFWNRILRGKVEN